MPDTTTAEPRVDLRNARSRRTRAAIVDACRMLMLAGNFRPTAAGVAEATGCSVRSVFQHFAEIEALHRAALADVPTRDGIAALIMPADRVPPPLDADCIAFAAVFGRPIPPKDEPPVAIPAAAE